MFVSSCESAERSTARALDSSSAVASSIRHGSASIVDDSASFSILNTSTRTCQLAVRGHELKKYTEFPTPVGPGGVVFEPLTGASGALEVCAAPGSR